MKRTIAVAFVAMLTALELFAADPAPAEVKESKVDTAKHAVVRELKRYADDAKEMVLAPAHWTPTQWAHFGEGVAAVATVYAADQHLYASIQRNRSSFTDDFAKAITPFGGRRALDLSVLLIISGLGLHDERLRDAGRDSLEAELWAGGIVTPLVKRALGRARPIRGEGTRSFHPFSSRDQSFPSGHATNAFALATAIAGHYDGWIVPTVVYAIATGVAVSRINDQAHFPSDVIAGALIGRAVAKGVVYRHRQGRTAWTVAPALFGGRPGLTVRITSR